MSGDGASVMVGKALDPRVVARAAAKLKFPSPTSSLPASARRL